MAVVVGDRRNIGDDQMRHPRRGRPGQRHGDLTAHRVAQQIESLDAEIVQQCDDIGCHRRIPHSLDVGRAAMIAQVNRNHATIVLPLLDMGAPVVRATEQSMQHDQR